MSEEDKILLESLGLQDIPEEEKQVILEEIDNKMAQRFLATLLATLSAEQAKELETEIADIPSENSQAIIEKIIEKHPDASKILTETAKQVVEEVKQGMPKNSDSSNTHASPSSDLETNSQANDSEFSSAPTEPSPAQTEQIEMAPPETPPLEIADTEDKPLPVPQAEQSKPFGDEIEIVKDEIEAPEISSTAPTTSATTSLATEPSAETIGEDHTPEPMSEMPAQESIAPEPPLSPQPPTETANNSSEPIQSEPMQTAPPTNAPLPYEAKPEATPEPEPKIDSNLNPFVDQPPAPGEQTDTPLSAPEPVNTIPAAAQAQPENLQGVVPQENVSPTPEPPQPPIPTPPPTPPAPMPPSTSDAQQAPAIQQG